MMKFQATTEGANGMEYCIFLELYHLAYWHYITWMHYVATLTSVNGSLAPRYFTYPASRDVYRKLNVTASSTTTKTVSTLTTTTTSSTKSTTVLDAWHFDVLDFVYRWLLLIWTWKDSFYLACSLVSVPVVRFATVFFFDFWKNGGLRHATY